MNSDTLTRRLATTYGHLTPADIDAARALARHAALKRRALVVNVGCACATSSQDQQCQAQAGEI